MERGGCDDAVQQKLASLWYCDWEESDNNRDAKAKTISTLYAMLTCRPHSIQTGMATMVISMRQSLADTPVQRVVYMMSATELRCNDFCLESQPDDLAQSGDLGLEAKHYHALASR